MRAGKKRAELVQGSCCKKVIAEAIGISPRHIHRISLLDVKDETLKEEIAKFIVSMWRMATDV